MSNINIKYMDFLTSDTHFGHTNIIKYTNRPFSNVEEMDEQIIENINNLVGSKDRLFHLGDFAFKHSKNIKQYLNKIKCKNIFLILGNHDKHLKKWERDLFAGCEKCETIKTNYNDTERKIFLFHYCCKVWDKSHHGVCHAWGHSHSTLEDDPNSLSMDVGIDNIAKLLSPNKEIRLKTDYRPISTNEFFEFMNKKNWKPIDHHGI